MHKTPRFHETDSTEPHVSNGYTNKSMILLHKTPRFQETDSTEPHVSDGYTNKSMILLHKNSILYFVFYNITKYEEWNS